MSSHENVVDPTLVAEVRKKGPETFAAEIHENSYTWETWKVYDFAVELLKDDDGELAEGLKNVQVCGKVWKEQDGVAYKCMTCQADPTCVVCVDCFEEDLHEGHNWRLVKTAGGLCDCGDPQAWARAGFCRKHRGFTENENPAEILLKPETRARCIAVCDGLCRVLNSAISVVEQDLDVNDPFSKVGGAAQVAIILLKKLTELARLGSAPGRILGEQLSVDHETEKYENSVHHKMLSVAVSKFDYGKTLDQVMHNFYLQMMSDFHMRRMLASAVSRRPELIAVEWISSLTVQIFSVHTIVRQYMEPNEAKCSPGFAASITQAMTVCLSKEMIQPIENYNGIKFFVDNISTASKLSFVGSVDPAAFRFFRSQMQMLEFTLAITSCSHYFCRDQQLFDRFLIYCLCLQRGHTCFREDVDSDIVPFVRLHHNQTRLFNVAAKSVSLCKSPDDTHVITNEVIRFIDVYLSDTLTSRDCEIDIPWLYQNNAFKNSKHGVAFQLPLHRLLSEMFMSIHETFPDASLVQILPADYIKRIETYTENALTTILTRAQCLSCMWRRNHMGIQTFADYYRTTPLDLFVLPDSFLLQIEAAISPTSMVVHTAHRFRGHQPLIETDVESERENNIVGHLIRLLLTLATDRTNFKEPIRQKVITKLAAGSKKFSQLTGLITETTNSEVLENILNEIATAEQTAVGTKFSLKKEMWCEVNPYTIAWEEQMLLTADSEYMNIKSGRTILPISKWVPPPKAFENLIGVIHNQFSLSIAVSVVKSFSSKSTSDGDIRAALDLILLALRTREQYKSNWSSIEASDKHFYPTRYEGGVKTLTPDSVTWEGGVYNDVVQVLTTKMTSNEIPLTLIINIVGDPKTKELTPTVKDIVNEIVNSNITGTESFEEQLGEKMKSTKKGGAKAKARTAKGKAKQKAALDKMNQQLQEVDLDLESSDEDEDGGDEEVQESLHKWMDLGWMGGEKCCLCQMDASPAGGCTDLGLVAFASRTAGLQQCFESVDPQRPNILRPLDDDTNAFNNTLLSKTGHVITHVCGHILHIDCLQSHLRYLKQSSAMRHHWNDLVIPAEFRGVSVLDIRASEYLCPLCGRIANTMCPIVGDGKRKVDLPSIMTVINEKNEEQLSRPDEEIEGLLTEVVNDPEICGELQFDARRIDGAYYHHLESFPKVLASSQFPESCRNASYTGGSILTWAQQIAVTELESRFDDNSSAPIPLKKLTFLRQQLKALLESNKYHTADVEGLRVLLHLPDTMNCPTGKYPLLTRDVFSIWIQILFNITLRVEDVNFSGYIYLMRRTVEAQLCKIILELLSAGIKVDGDRSMKDLAATLQSAIPRNVRLKESENLNIIEHINRELSVMLSYMVITHSVVTAPLTANHLVLPSLDTPIEAFSKLSSLLPLGDGYKTINEIASTILNRDEELASVSKWVDQLEGKSRQISPPIRSNLPLKLGIELPHEYTALVAKYHDVKCECQNQVVNACLCLKCGVVVDGKSLLKERDPWAMVDISRDETEKRSCCTCKKHAASCGAGESLFMSLNQTRLIAVYGNRYALIPPLYVDQYGEEDPKLYRGKPLYLSKLRVDRMKRIAAFSLYGFDTEILESSQLLNRPQL